MLTARLAAVAVRALDVSSEKEQARQTNEAMINTNMMGASVLVTLVETKGRVKNRRRPIQKTDVDTLSE